MAFHHIGVVPLAAVGVGDLEEFPDVDEFVQRVVDRGEADLGKDLASTLEYLVGGHVHVLAGHRLGDDTTLRRQPPPAVAEAIDQRSHACRPSSGRTKRSKRASTCSKL